MSDKKQPSFLDAALTFAEKGWRVFPIVPKTKKPLIKEWQTLATNNPDQVKAWWSQSPHSNIGIATGKESILVVLDVDIDEEEGKRRE